MRTKNKQVTDVFKPSALIISDMHLRDTPPLCRAGEDWFAVMSQKINTVLDVAKSYNIPILDGGDIFHKWKSSPNLTGWSIRTISGCDFYTVAGNHDLPAHNMEQYYHSSLSVLESAGSVKVLKNINEIIDMGDFYLSGCGWGCETRDVLEYKNDNNKVLILHAEVYNGNSQIWQDSDNSCDAKKLLTRYPGYKLIIVGHNHDAFTYCGDAGRIVLSPGSMFRTTIDQIDYKPKYYLWDAKTNEIREHYFIVDKIEKIVDNKQEVEAGNDCVTFDFIKYLKTDTEIDISFRRNVESYINKNNVDEKVKSLLYESLESEV